MLGPLVLYSFPIVVVVLFKKLPLQTALIWSILLGYLFLPSAFHVGFDLPLLPAINKELIPPLSAAIMAIIVTRQQTRQQRGAQQAVAVPRIASPVLPGWLPRSKLGFVLTVLFLVGAVMSVLTNNDTIRYPGVVLPAQRPYDIFSQLLYWGVLFLPMLLGRKFLADAAGHRLILFAFCMSALIYSFPMLYEVRMSPRINMMVYDFFPHSWLQHRRAGGWRPIVFLNHGLLVGIFVAMAVISTAALVRMSKGAVKAGYAVLLLWLTGVLFLAKTLGALILALILAPFALLAPIRLQLMFAAIIAGIVMLYPMLRGAGVIPVDDIVAFFETVDPARADSLAFRIENEDMMLARANERPLFGWSGWSRWRVFDPQTGQDLTVADGFWVITIGESGWVGYIARFGLFCLPMMIFFFRRKQLEIDMATSGLCLAVTANLFDLIPNAAASPIFFLAVGALLGRLEPRPDAVAAAAAGAPDRRQARPSGRRGPELVADPVPDAMPDGAAAAVTRYSRFAPKKRRET